MTQLQIQIQLPLPFAPGAMPLAEEAATTRRLELLTAARRMLALAERAVRAGRAAADGSRLSREQIALARREASAWRCRITLLEDPASCGPGRPIDPWIAYLAAREGQL